MSRRFVTVASVLVGLYLAVFAFRGCASAALPPSLSDEQLKVVRSTRFRTTVGVERCEWPAYSDGLVESLRRTNLFDRVDHLDRVSDAQLIARVDRRICGTATIPIFTMVSLGIIPTIVDEEWGESFTLSRAGDARSGLQVEFAYTGPTTLGWIGALASLSPNSTAGNPRDTGRFSDALALAICSQAAAIEDLLKPR